MRPSLFAGLLVLPLMAPALRADDKAKDAPKPPATPAEQFRALTEQFDKDYQAAVSAFRAAKDDKDKAAARDRAYKVPADFAPKVMAIVEKHPKDPIVPDALFWVASAASRRALPEPPQAKEAIDRLVRDHVDNENLGHLALLLMGQEGGEKTIRTVREKSKHPVARTLAGYALANALRESEEQTEARVKETEALLADVAAKAKDIKGLPDDLKDAAEELLKEVQVVSVGKTAPPAESADLDGKPTKLSDYKGKVVVLDFWATWCGPCVEMIPHERELVKKYAGKPFVFISVSVDEKKEDVKEFMDKEKMPWVHWWNGEKGGVAEKWFVKSYPMIYVIDAKGVIRGRITSGGKTGEQRLDVIVDALLREAGAKSE